RVKDDVTFDDLIGSTAKIIRHETGVLRDQLRRNGVDLIHGEASFEAADTIVVRRAGDERRVRASRVLIAVGSRPARPPGMDFDGRSVIDSNQILTIDEIPRTLIVVGAGVIGVEYACIFAALGTRVTLINQSDTFLEFVDAQIRHTLAHHMRSRGVEFRFGEEVTGIERRGPYIVAATASGKALAADRLLYSVGRQGNTDRLNLPAAGLTADARGRIAVNAAHQTEVETIYAAGDVVGFPALAATSREQGRIAVRHMFGCARLGLDTPMPYGIYAIPEISMIGPTEQELTAARTPYEIGVARYSEIARGQILGDEAGLLKLLFDPDSRRLLAVHVIGEGATELVHIGQAAIAFGAPVDYFAETVFNYPTLAEAYKVAALDGLNRLRMLDADPSAGRLAA
ncbi:MAG: Si-specific NAD(P)(+) transhydrogenase, partial [Planctomycetota bacterium]